MVHSNLALKLAVVLCLSGVILAAENGELSSLVVSIKSSSSSSKSTNNLLLPRASHGESCVSDGCVAVNALTCNQQTAKCQCFNSNNLGVSGYALNMDWDASLGRCNSKAGSLCSGLHIPFTDENNNINPVKLYCIEGYSCKKLNLGGTVSRYEIGTCTNEGGSTTTTTTEKGSSSDAGAQQSSGWLKFMIPIVAVAAIFQY